MIKIALKHWIYEKCIDVLFKAIDNNFPEDYRQNLFSPGVMFVTMTIKWPELEQSIILCHCTILGNIEGRCLIEFHGSKVIGGTIQSYKFPQKWVTHTNNIIRYYGRVPA